MVNTVRVNRSTQWQSVRAMVAFYVVLLVATVVVLAVLSRTDTGQAPDEAWIHAGIVAVFAVLLPVRVRAARRGSRRAAGAVAVIATVLMVVNAVEAAIPGLFPVWMRIEMVGIAVLMAAVVVTLRRGPR